MKLYLSATILSSLVIGSSAQCAADCWCIPEAPDATGACPAIGMRTDVTNVPQVLPEIQFFGSIAPADNSQYTLDPPGCQPFPTVAGTFGQPLCTGVASPYSDEDGDGSSETQCNFYYDGDICDGGTYSVYQGSSYPGSSSARNLKKDKASKGTKKAKKSKKSKNDKSTPDPLITHEGPCGVCSSAQDLAAYMSVTLLPDSQACALATAGMLADPALAPMVLPASIDCHLALGFTQGCATVWASGAIATSLEVQLAAASLVPGGPTYSGPDSCVRCAQQCLPDFTAPQCLSAFVGDTCELAPCVACEEEAVEPIFQSFSGRSRRRSGILGADIKRPCSAIPDIDQPFVACPAPTIAPVPAPVALPAAPVLAPVIPGGNRPPASNDDD